jgi:hypothetical protein
MEQSNNPLVSSFYFHSFVLVIFIIQYKQGKLRGTFGICFLEAIVFIKMLHCNNSMKEDVDPSFSLVQTDDFG